MPDWVTGKMHHKVRLISCPRASQELQQTSTREILCFEETQSEAVRKQPLERIISLTRHRKNSARTDNSPA